MSNDSLDTLRQRIRAGDRKQARRELVALLRADPQNVPAWELLATVLEDPARQADCYRQILRVVPGHRHASARLEALAGLGVLAEDETRSDPAPGGHPPQPAAEIEKARKLLREKGLRALDDETIQRLREHGFTSSTGYTSPRTAVPPPALSEHPGCLARLLGPLGVSISRGAGRATPGYRPFGRGDIQSQLGQLSPEEIVQLAGEPIPAEERQKCPQCGAVVSRDATRCAWCEAVLAGQMTNDE